MSSLTSTSFHFLNSHFCYLLVLLPFPIPKLPDSLTFLISFFFPSFPTAKPLNSTNMSVSSPLQHLPDSNLANFTSPPLSDLGEVEVEADASSGIDIGIGSSMDERDSTPSTSPGLEGLPNSGESKDSSLDFTPLPPPSTKSPRSRVRSLSTSASTFPSPSSPLWPLKKDEEGERKEENDADGNASMETGERGGRKRVRSNSLWIGGREREGEKRRSLGAEIELNGQLSGEDLKTVSLPTSSFARAQLRGTDAGPGVEDPTSSGKPLRPSSSYIGLLSEGTEELIQGVREKRLSKTSSIGSSSTITSFNNPTSSNKRLSLVSLPSPTLQRKSLIFSPSLASPSLVTSTALPAVKVRDFAFSSSDPRHVGDRLPNWDDQLDDEEDEDEEEEAYARFGSRVAERRAAAGWAMAGSVGVGDGEDVRDELGSSKGSSSNGSSVSSYNWGFKSEEIVRGLNGEGEEEEEEEDGGEGIWNGFGPAGNAGVVENSGVLRTQEEDPRAVEAETEGESWEGKLFKAAYEFVAEGESEMCLTRGDVVRVLEAVCEGWVVAEKVRLVNASQQDGESVDAGLVPADYLEIWNGE